MYTIGDDLPPACAFLAGNPTLIEKDFFGLMCGGVSEDFVDQFEGALAAPPRGGVEAFQADRLATPLAGHDPAG